MDSFEFTNHVNIVIDREDRDQTEHFDKKTSRFLGRLQIGLGIVSILCENGVIIFVSWCQEGTNYYIDWTDYMGGVFFILAGIFGVVSSRNSSSCNIITFLLQSIIASLVAVAQLTLNFSNLQEVDSGLILPAILKVKLVVAAIEAVIGIFCAGRGVGTFCRGVDGASDVVINEEKKVLANVKTISGMVASTNMADMDLPSYQNVADAEANMGLPSYQDVADAEANIISRSHAFVAVGVTELTQNSSTFKREINSNLSDIQINK